MILKPGFLTLPQLRQIAREQVSLQLDPASHAAIDACAKAVADIAAKGEPAYGINTGFGRLASTHIPRDQLELLQRNLVLSHAVGVGQPMSRPVVRLLIALKLSSLGRGHSGIRREVMEALITLFNADVLPVIPVKGSVGASGDLAPLAHMSATLLGVGEVFAKGERMPATEGLALVGLKPLTLQAKEGLALLNGTQASTALALYNMFAIEDLYRTALVSGALCVDAAMGSVKPFDARIHELRGHQGQIDAAAAYRSLLEGSGINVSHADCDKVQDPYSLRCQPQVMGACLDQMRHAANVLLLEANAVSDNPLIFPDTGEVLSGGNFHAEPVAFAADNLALAAAEIGALAERRIALLIDATLVGPAAVPRARRRRELRLHDCPRDSGRARVGKQDARASGIGRFAAYVGEPGRPRVDGDVRRAQTRRHRGKHREHSVDRTARRCARRRSARTAQDQPEFAKGAGHRTRGRRALRARSLLRTGHRSRHASRAERHDREAEPVLVRVGTVSFSASGSRQ